MAYVGKGSDGSLMTPVRIQVSQPEVGAHLSKSGSPYHQTSGAFYLVDNPNYYYYWIDSSPEIIQSNAVFVNAKGPNTYSRYIGRMQVDGQTHVSVVAPFIGFNFFDSDNVERVAKSYQILVCDPKPVNPCSEY
jgi:hypothetical protein